MKLVVFDFDGTLSDSRSSIVRTFQEASMREGFDAPSEAAVAQKIGLPLVQMFEQILPGISAAQNAALVASYKASYVAIDSIHTSLFEGVEALLSSLERYTLAIATSKSQTGAEASVGRAGLTAHFDLIVGHDTVARPKPNPDMLEHICTMLSIPASEAVMVGDTTFDLEMADNAGMRAIGVGWGMHGATGLSRWPVVHSVSELREAIG